MNRDIAKQGERLAELYPLMIEDMMGSLNAADSRRLSDLLQESWALDEWTRFHQSFTGKEDIEKAEQRLAAARSSGVSEKIKAQEARKKQQKKSTVVLLSTLLVMAAITGWQHLQEAFATKTSLRLQLPDQQELVLTAGATLLPDETIVYTDTVQHTVRFSPGACATTAMHRLQTPPGSCYTLVLADSSKLTLAPDTQLHFPFDFGSGKRQVDVHGTVFIEAAGDASHPLVVHLGRTQVNVLGTSFEVSHTDTTATVVSLHTGSVQIAAAGVSPVRLAPGQRAIVAADRTAITVRAFVPVVPSWKGEYEIDYITMSALAPLLRERFGIKVAVAPSMAKSRYHGIIRQNEKLEKFISTFRFASDARGTEYKDSVLYIK